MYECIDYALLKQSDLIQHDEFVNTGDVAAETLLTFILEQQPFNGRRMFPRALRNWISGVLQAPESSEASEETRSWEEAAQFILRRALAPSIDAHQRVWILRTIGSLNHSWAFVSLLAVLALERQPRSCSRMELLELTLAALETLPQALPEDLKTHKWAQVAIAEAMIAVTISHCENASRKQAFRCLDRLCCGYPTPLEALKNLRSEIRHAADSVDAMLQGGDLKYLDPITRSAAKEAVEKLIVGSDLPNWMFLFLNSPQGLLHSATPRFRIVGVFFLQVLVESTQQPQGWAELTKSLQDSDVEVRGMACDALVRISAKAAESGAILPLLRPLLYHSLQSIREHALEVTKVIVQDRRLSNTEVENARDLVVVALEDEDLSMCLQAISLCRDLGKFGQAILPLAALLQSEKEQIRIQACVALAAVTDRNDSLAAAAVTALVGFLKQSRDDGHKIAALQSLAEIAFAGHKETRWITLQIVKEKRQSFKVRAMAMKTLGCTCLRDDEEAVTVLTSAIKELFSESSHEIAKQILTMKFSGVSLLASLEECLHGEGTRSHWTLRRSILRALGASATRGCPRALALVKPCLDDCNTDVRYLAVEVVVALADPASPEIPQLLRSIRDRQDVLVQDAIDMGLDLLETCASSLESTESVPHNVANIPWEELWKRYENAVVKDLCLESESAKCLSASPKMMPAHTPEDEDNSWDHRACQMPIEKVWDLYDNVVAKDITLEDDIRSKSEDTCSCSDPDSEISSASGNTDLDAQTVMTKYNQLVAIHDAMLDQDDLASTTSQSSGCTEKCNQDAPEHRQVLERGVPETHDEGIASEACSSHSTSSGFEFAGDSQPKFTPPPRVSRRCANDKDSDESAVTSCLDEESSAKDFEESWLLV